MGLQTSWPNTSFDRRPACGPRFLNGTDLIEALFPVLGLARARQHPSEIKSFEFPGCVVETERGLLLMHDLPLSITEKRTEIARRFDSAPVQSRQCDGVL